MEEYRSLYRKYRPQSPDEVLGQEHVVRALAGAVKEGRLAHAFLFSGPRGTGKTSTARILAKMVNCEKGPTAEPCGTCEQCLRIRDGSHLDVDEIDAASHGSVDYARELRERAPTAPAQGREKVYIIDEAQRLSREAFDALLKVFEEPPPGVRFVLATTEPHKMPATIVGRCQWFEFRRVPSETIAEHLAGVAKEEDLKASPEALTMIARESEGSVRDALSLLDQSAVLGGGEVTEEVVASLIGTPDLDVLLELADAVAVGDPRGVFGVIHGLVEEGHDLRHFAARTSNHFRNLLLARTSPDDPAILDVPPEAHGRLAAQASKFSSGELDRVLGLLLQAQSDMRWSTAPRLTLELTLVRAALPETDPAPAALISRIERLERLAGMDPTSAGRPADDHPPDPTATEPREDPPSADPTGTDQGGEGDAGDGPEAPAAELSSLTSSDDGASGPPKPDLPPASIGSVTAEMLRRSWGQVIDALRDRRKMVVFANAQVATVGSFDGETLELVFPPGREFGPRKVEEKQEDLQEVLRELFGVSPRIRCTVREGAVVEAVHDEPPPSPEAAEELLRRQLGAEVVEDAEE
ncbi:MAG TPA: DNA polymerase III subunit gamma/tau [Actinomycetota bacterium]